MFQPLNTADHTTSYNKVLLYTTHGWGKTSQAKHYQAAYGPGFIISGESGLKSIRSAGIDYLPFSSWDGAVDPANQVFSFKSIIKMISTPEFKAKGYKWIMIDSLTELSDLCFAAAEEEAAKPENLSRDGKVNGFAVWEEYSSMIIGACKWVRDLPMHVIVTALAKEGDDENGNKEYWPMVKGKQAQTQLPGIFDYVFCGVKVLETPTEGSPKNIHYIVTDSYKGWRGKARDEKRRLRPVEREHDVTKLFDRMEMPDDQYENYKASINQQQGTTTP